MYLLVGVLHIIMHRQLGRGLGFISLGFVFFLLSFNCKRKNIRFDLIDKDEESLNLVSKGNKNKAIKRCRVIANCGLKEAVDYVESIMNFESE